MKRASVVTVLLAMGLLVASSFAAAQEVTLPKDYLFGQAAVSLLGADNVGSSKFQEYRDLSDGAFGPEFSLAGSKAFGTFSLHATNVARDDQRYFGQASFEYFKLAFDYNQTPHNMGNFAQTFLAETSDGVYSLSPTLRKSIGGTADATTTKNFPFYSGLLGPSLASSNAVDITSLRKRGNVEVGLGDKLPFDLSFTYARELKTGYRGLGGADIVGAVTSQVEVPSPLNEVVQDFGFRGAYNFKQGNVHASFNRNLYDNRAETTVIDNPFQATDVVSASNLGGPGSVRVVNAPDNEASTGRVGFMLKFKRLTRVTGDLGLARWTQNAAFYPYTINSTIKTGSGAPANLVSSLQQPSLNGKINTTTANFAFSSRPVEGLGIRLRYRSYDLTNKTARFVIAGDTSNAPDRTWGAADAPNAEAPFGHPTAVNYDTKTQGFTASVSYDVKGLTLEGVGRTSKITRTFREATSGKENGFAFSALYHATDLVGIRGTVDQAKRTASGETLYGFQSDEAERKTTRAGLDVELTPNGMFGVTLAYFRRNVDYPNRPDRIAASGGVPVAGAQPIPGTPSGLLGAKYDSFTTEVEFTPSERAEVAVYYTYEKDATTNQWATTTGVVLNNLLNYRGTDKTNSFGASALFHIVPEKWTLSLSARHQKVDGLMDITAREEKAPAAASNFYTPGRVALIPPGSGGAADIPEWDDTKLTSAGLQLDYAFTKAWVFSVGYGYEKYTFADAFTSSPSLLQPTVMIFMKPDTGGYHASIGYAKLGYRF